MQRIAVPMIGGVLTLVVIPVIYAMVKGVRLGLPQTDCKEADAIGGT